MTHIPLHLTLAPVATLAASLLTLAACSAQPAETVGTTDTPSGPGSAAAPAASPQTRGDVITLTLPAIRGETEPGAQFAGNWPAVYETREIIALPAGETARVIAQIRTLGAFAPPPYLIEMGRRLGATDVEEGAYWYYLGLLRTQWAAMSCSDRTAQAGIGMVRTAFAEADPATLARFEQPDVRRAALTRIGDGDAIFEGTASAWWICSHGMRAMTASMDGGARTVPLDEWYASATDRAAAEAELRDSVREALAGPAE